MQTILKILIIAVIVIGTIIVCILNAHKDEIWKEVSKCLEE